MVTQWGVVGPGFTRLAAATATLLAGAAALSGGGVAAAAGAVLLAAATIVASRRRIAVVLCLGAVVALLIAAVLTDRVLLALTSALLLGGVTSEMLLGHWYLVDPRLPRPALRRLCLFGLVGALVDPAAALVLGALPATGSAVLPIGWGALAVASALLMAAVWAALGERGYPAVMAATGLSYLAVLTSIGSVVLARVLVAGETLG